MAPYAKFVILTLRLKPHSDDIVITLSINLTVNV